ncbi:metalloregulator ArsR/SmtB family transcription factor [Amycolatopsis sp. FBCC-B4732]|uniref:metalloregulator ArsR/SmtB family transcription factor n=1 Tax=Amycolatopsis sp. FBCC-B4732 TaxID=3079339 RepID=UPI001FF57CE7|nr:metalloregulator ArsR/SmtB family transcription factor [Amycolatopsis sp. FBCC-B4732]UOX89847.1 metalloregulator ArsR/SmtB family transcription factor [Amycolatopsis sp. FBCC-B4732]
MDGIAAALGDAARWRIVELLAERPRSVGELAELTGLRQPQTTKHLQTLARAGLVTVFPLGQRRVYALEAEPLAAFAGRLRELAEATAGHAGERDVVARYRAAIEADSAAAGRDRWADGREFAFDRLLPVSRETLWRYWTDPDLLASWWVPAPLTLTDCGIEPRPGGRAVIAYRDADGEYRSEGKVHVADEPRHLAFDLAVPGPASFTGHYDLTFTEVPEGTRLRLGLRITATTTEALSAIAGIETGWGQVLDNLTAVLIEKG